MNKIVHLFLLFSIVAAKHFLLEIEAVPPKWGDCFKEKNGFVTHHGSKKLDGCHHPGIKGKRTDCHKGYAHDTLPYDLREKYFDCQKKGKNVVEKNDDDFVDPCTSSKHCSCNAYGDVMCA